MMSGRLPLVALVAFFILPDTLAAVLSPRMPMVSKSSVLDDVDNSLDANVQMDERQSKAWVKIARSPPAMIKHAMGTVLELDCEATGSPAPTIQWLRDNSPITEFDDFESNTIIGTRAESVARVRGKLIVNDITPADRTTYTCMARAGIKTAAASTEVYNTPGVIPKPHNLSGYLALNREIMESPTAPKIVQYYSSILEIQDRDVIIPCKAIGNPHPQVYWFDDAHNPVLPGNPRLKVLASGELLISGLRWQDMGGYTCVAKNSISKDSIVTFVYPMADEE